MYVQILATTALLACHPAEKCWCMAQQRRTGRYPYEYIDNLPKDKLKDCLRITRDLIEKFAAT